MLFLKIKFLNILLKSVYLYICVCVYAYIIYIFDVINAV